MLRHSARLEVTLCGWQDVKIQWLGNQLGHGTEARRSLIQSVTHATGTKLQQTLLALLCNFTSYYFLSGRKKKEKRLGDAAVPSYGFLLARTPTQTFLQTQTHTHTQTNNRGIIFLNASFSEYSEGYFEDVPWVYLPCTYPHAMWELQQAIQVPVASLVRRALLIPFVCLFWKLPVLSWLSDPTDLQRLIDNIELLTRSRYMAEIIQG